MAQRVTVELTDDIDGTEAAETIAFRVDGTAYEIDPLNEERSEDAPGLRTLYRACTQGDRWPPSWPTTS